jgi:hypothetical protein
LPAYCNLFYFSAGVDDGGPNVQVLKLSVIFEGREDIELDLTGSYQNLAHLVIKIPSFCLPFPSRNSFEILLSSCHPVS